MQPFVVLLVQPYSFSIYIFHLSFSIYHLSFLIMSPSVSTRDEFACGAPTNSKAEITNEKWKMTNGK